MDLVTAANNFSITKAIRDKDYKLARRILREEEGIQKKLMSYGKALTTTFLTFCFLPAPESTEDQLAVWQTLVTKAQDINVITDNGSLLHWIIKLYSSYPSTYLVMVFKLLLTYSDIDINTLIVRIGEAVCCEHSQGIDGIRPRGTPLSFSLEFKNTRVLSIILLKFGANPSYVNWQKITLNSSNEYFLKKLICAGHLPPYLFEKLLIKANINNDKYYKLVMNFAMWVDNVMTEHSLTFKTAVTYRDHLTKYERIDWVMTDTEPTSISHLPEFTRKLILFETVFD